MGIDKRIGFRKAKRLMRRGHICRNEYIYGLFLIIDGRLYKNMGNGIGGEVNEWRYFGPPNVLKGFSSKDWHETGLGIKHLRPVCLFTSRDVDTGELRLDFILYDGKYMVYPAEDIGQEEEAQCKER
jgi:hypothetical protein